MAEPDAASLLNDHATADWPRALLARWDTQALVLRTLRWMKNA
jgi:hypothetical protein